VNDLASITRRTTIEIETRKGEGIIAERRQAGTNELRAKERTRDKLLAI